VSYTSNSKRSTQCAVRVIFKNKKPVKIEKALKNLKKIAKQKN